MTDYKRPPSERDCHPAPADPAPQPKPPKHKECPTFDDPKPPALPEVPPCPPPKDCKCPTPPTSTPGCLETLIQKQAGEIVAAEKAKAFKADLEALLTKARAASQEYTQDKYDKLLKQWIEQDAAIAELIRKLVCAVPCWRCIVECYVCPLLNAMRADELKLYGDDKPPSDLHNQYDLHYWLTRDKDYKERRFGRIKGVLTAWEKPAQSIEKALNDNAKAISEAGTALGANATKVVFDVLMRIVPLHLSIAPPAATAATKIDKKFTEICPCDGGKPDDCCGPDVGVLSFRQRLIGPQAYLIEPGKYYDVICCLVEKWYLPAKEALALAEGEVAKAESEIKTLKGRIDNGLKSFDKDARAAIPAVVDCCDIEEDGDDSRAS